MGARHRPDPDRGVAPQPWGRGHRGHSRTWRQRHRLGDPDVSKNPPIPVFPRHELQPLPDLDHPTHPGSLYLFADQPERHQPDGNRFGGNTRRPGLVHAFPRWHADDNRSGESFRGPPLCSAYPRIKWPRPGRVTTAFYWPQPGRIGNHRDGPHPRRARNLGGPSDYPGSPSGLQ